jgi:acyl carrier protein
MPNRLPIVLCQRNLSDSFPANAFLDALAHHRRSQGLPAISLVLPMILGIGYIAENPEIEASIRRKGMYGIDESEMLAAFEVAMTPELSSSAAVDHIIAGLEPSRLAKSVSATSADIFWTREPRLRTLGTAMKQHMAKEGSATGDSIVAAISNARQPAEAIDAVKAYLVQRLSRLLMIRVEEFQPETRSIASYGLDSMIGAEFRNWVFREFKVDIPFQQLLAGNLTVAKLATELCEKAENSKKR